MVERRMYVIGGFGAIAGHEGFGPDYVKPPNNGYLETLRRHRCRVSFITT